MPRRQRHQLESLLCPFSELAVGMCHKHRALAPFALQACERAGVKPEELAAFVPHQANTRIIDGIVKRLGLSPDVVIAKDLVESGNTSAASVPLALSKLIERREVPSGAPVLLFGFGGGLTYAGQVIRCP